MKIKSLLMTNAIMIIVFSAFAQVKGTFTDSRDGKIYKTVKIGTQTWMAENLAYYTNTKKETKIEEKKEECSNWVVSFKNVQNAMYKATYTFDTYCDGYKGFYHVWYDWSSESGYNKITIFDVNENITHYMINDGLFHSGEIWYGSKKLGDNVDKQNACALALKYYLEHPKPAEEIIIPGITSYNNDPNNVKVYGYLYTWAVAKCACPPSWHLPSKAEWLTLTNFLIANGYNYDGTKNCNKIAKSLSSIDGWDKDSGIGTVGNTDFSTKRNVVGFNAIPGGERSPEGYYMALGTGSSWWSATDNNESAINCGLYFSSPDLDSGSSNNKSWGYSVRCIKNK